MSQSNETRNPGNPALTLLQGELEPPAQTEEYEAATGAAPTEGVIFPGSPVTALGVEGDLCHYLDMRNQLRSLKKHGIDEIRHVFGGRVDLLLKEFPSYNKDGVAKRFDQAEAAAAMVRACYEKGIWSATDKVRGLGAWPDDDGGVALHCGDKILYKGEWHAPGEIDGYVYPGLKKTPKPLSKLTSPEDEAPGAALLDALKTWQWQRGDVDAYLLLGWLSAALFGGALHWRPMMWLSGDKGTGKSTLQEIIGNIFGENSLLQPAGATEAAIRQYTGQSTIPVAIDELEPDADNSRVKAIVKLARLASSGGMVIRGGQDHTAHQFLARNSFLFSSILIPSMLDQDISRIAVLDLLPLKKGSVAPEPSPARWGRIGRALRTKVLQNWPRLRRTLDLYQRALTEAGHNHRGADQFGTLLTMADLVLFDDIPDDVRLQSWAEKLSASIVQDRSEISYDWQRCLSYLFTQEVDIYRGGSKLSVGAWVAVAAGLDDSEDIERAHKTLTSIGLRVKGRGKEAQLIVANINDGLARLFQGTRWYADSASNGVWTQTLRRIPGATATGALRFNMVPSRCTKFPLSAIPGLFGEENVPEAAQPVQAPSNPLIPHDIQDFE